MIKKYICGICYREFEEGMMKKFASGEISNQCTNCYNIIGKGPGYSNNSSEDEDRKWFENTNERREKLIKEGKLEK